MNSLASRSLHHLPPMRRFLLPFAVLAATFVISNVFAQSVVTDPVGFYSASALTGKSLALSLSLDNTPANFSGPASAVTASTVMTNSAGWTVNAFGPFASNPHIIRILSGTGVGQQFRIASNTADTLTLTTNGTDLTTVMAAGNRYEILTTNTLASVFGATGTGLLTNADPQQADNVLINIGTGWLTFFNDGTKWLRVSGGTASQNNVAILPEQAVLFVRRGATDLPLTVVGSVPTTNLITPLPANKSTFLANRFPVDTTLVGLGLSSLPGWTPGSDPNTADNVLLNIGTGWLTYYYDGTKWLRVSGGTGAQNPTIKTGSAVLIVRRAGSDIVYNQPLPYVLN